MTENQFRTPMDTYVSVSSRISGGWCLSGWFFVWGGYSVKNETP